jgi:hypothetical protein
VIEDWVEIGGGMDPGVSRSRGRWRWCRWRHRWDEGGEDGGDLIGVIAALGGAPIGGVNVFFYRAAVEAAEGEGVDGEDVEVFGMVRKAERLFEVGGIMSRVAAAAALRRRPRPNGLPGETRSRTARTVVRRVARLSDQDFAGVDV